MIYAEYVSGRDPLRQRLNAAQALVNDLPALAGNPPASYLL